MSTSENLIISGVINGIIFYGLRGKQCQRSMPIKVKNPRTIRQIQNRDQFGLVSKLASNVLHSLIHPYWNPIAKKLNRTGYNLFLSDNNPAFRNGVYSAERLTLCPDNGLNHEKFSVEKDEDKIQITWNSSLSDHRKNDKDQLYLIVLKNDFTIKIIETDIIRENNYYEFEISESEKQKIFAFWKNGLKWSASKLVFVSPCAMNHQIS